MNERPRPIPPEKLRDCFELYLKHKGRNLKLIEREMREKGWAKFSCRILHCRGVVKPGWIMRFGWKEKLRNEEKDESIPMFGELSCNSAKSKRTVTAKQHEKSRNKKTDQNPRSAFRNPQSKDAFHEWLQSTSPQWTWDWPHQRILYEKLRAVTSGESRRLMIFMPPRHGKSELVTVRYSAWRLLQDTSLNIILGSYNQKLANRFSRKIRRVLSEPPASAGGFLEEELTRNKGEKKTRTKRSVTAEQEERTEKQPDRIITPKGVTLNARPANTVAEWETSRGGGVRAVGVGAGVTGFGAGLIVIDDPVKNRAEAESETYRDKVWDWFNDDIYTRLEPGASIILIQTRWHEDDLAGRLIKEMEDGGEQWDVVSLPALAEADVQSYAFTRDTSEEITPKGVTLNGDPLGRKEGEALCPERYDEKALERIKKKLGSYSFAALYQQRPAPLEGGLFKRKWFKTIVDKAPENLRWARGYDLAVSTKTSADFTASFRCTFDKKGNLYIADGFRKRIEYPEQRRYVIERMRAEKNTEHGIEAALHGQAFVQELRRQIRLANVPLRAVRVDADKFTRALAWANLAEEGRVYLVRGAWTDHFLDEICRFPNGRFDDQIDAVSLAVKMLSRGGKSMGF